MPFVVHTETRRSNDLPLALRKGPFPDAPQHPATTMKPSLKLLLPVLVASSAGCALVARVLMIPVALVAVIFAGLAGIFVGAEGLSDDEELRAGGIRIDERVLDLRVAEDTTFEGSLRQVATVTSTAGLSLAQKAALSYDPRTQSLELVQARVVHADGSEHLVGPEQVFERPSTVAEGAPGFVSSVTKSVLFPQLMVGSQTHVEWRFEERAPSSLGFNFTWRPSFALPVTVARIRVDYDQDLAMRFDAQEPFVVSRGREGERKVFEAVLENYEGQRPERAMVAPRDVTPRFVATTTKSWESIGAAFHGAVVDRIERTPEIETLSNEIVGERDGADAAKAIHRWICQNIHYVVVHLNQMDGWVPHPASEVLENGYGDCKDMFVLFASLLAVQDIEALPVLTTLDRGFQPLALPTPLQFNHCMGYLPGLDLYSNPTDPYRDLGQLHSALSDKFVVIGSEAGRTARTPKGSADQNLYRVHHRVRIDEEGQVTGTSVIDVEGGCSGNFRATLAKSANANLAAEELLHAGVLGGFGDFETTDPADLETPFHGEGTWHSDLPIAMGEEVHFTTPTGIDFLNAGLLREFLTTKKRRYPLLITAIQIEMHFEIELPDGFEYGDLPADRLVENEAGHFTSRYRSDAAGVLKVERHIRIEHDHYAPEHYPALREVLLESAIDLQTILSAHALTPAGS